MAHIFVTTEAELKPGFDTEKPSKTQIKEQMTALESLGYRLVGVSKEKLAQLDLPERLYDAVMDANKITANGAKARQKAWIGKQMRTLDDAHIELMKERFLAWDGLSKAETSKLHLVEHWRDALLTNDSALDEFLQEYPQNADTIGAMRTAMRQARKDATSNKPPKNARVLFQLVKTAIVGNASPASDADLNEPADE